MPYLFLHVLNLSLIGSYIILIVLLARVLLRKSPKWCSYLLWGVVFVRLILPVFPESEFSLIPDGLSVSEYVTEHLQAGQQSGEQTGGETNKGALKDGQMAGGTEGIVMNGAAAGNAAEPIQDNAGDGTGTGLPQSDHTSAGVGMLQQGSGGTANELQQQGHTGSDMSSELHEQDNSGANTEQSQSNTDAEIGSQQDTAEAFTANGNANKLVGILSTLSYIWLTGMIILGIYHVYSYNRFKKQVSNATAAEDGVYEMQGMHISCVMGIWKPAIYLSGELDAESRRVVLCHEQVHLSRRDYLIKPLALAVLCVHWFNPLVWLAFYLMGRDCEMSCDEKVVSILGEDCKKIYSLTLLDEATGRARLKNKRENMCAVLSFGEDSIKSRIKHVLHYKKAPVWLIGGTVVVLAVLVAGLCSNGKGEEAEYDFERRIGMACIATNYEEKEDGRYLTFLVNEGEEDLRGREVVTKVEDVFAEKREYWATDRDITSSQTRPRNVLEAWATAFQNKDGEALHDLSYDQEAFLKWDMIVMQENGSITVGYSSPWPTRDDYEIFYEKGEEDVTIRYWMHGSEPSVFPCEEQVKLIRADGLYYVQHVSLTSYSEINTLKEFVAAYVPFEIRENEATEVVISRDENPVYNWTGNTGYDKSHMRYIYDHVKGGTNPDYYGAYKHPVTAAKLMLNLGEGSGEISEYLYIAEPQAMALLRTENNETNAENVPEWQSLRIDGMFGEYVAVDRILGEGSIVNVTYTFKEDGSSVQIPMVLAEETLGLWALSSGDLTGAESQAENAGQQEGASPQTRGALPGDAAFLAREVKQEIEYAEGEFLQISDYGIYRLNTEGLVNIFTEKFPTNVSFYYNTNDRQLYFPVDTLYEEYALDWSANCICVLDAVSGTYRYITHERASSLTGESSFSVRNGFIYVYGASYPFYDAEAVWNGKTTAELSGEEKDAYGTYIREYILAHPGEMIEVSNRYNGWTEAIIDMDGDGKAEDIIVEQIAEQYDAYDHYFMKTGDFAEERFSNNLYNEIWALSLDGENIWAVLYEDGPSSDPQTIFFRYEDNKLVEAGHIGHYIHSLNIADGIIHATMRTDVLQTDWVLARYGVDASRNISLIAQEVYEFTVQNDVTLKTDLTLHSAPDSADTIVLSSQNVKFTRVADGFRWVCLEAENGQNGWLEVEDFGTLADGTKTWEIFDGLNMVD